jgi:hypothetical protein
MKTYIIICHLIVTLISLVNALDDCSVGQYRCKSHKCIDLTQVCNGQQDCPDGDDEITTYCKGTAIEKEYKNLVNKYDSFVKQGDSYVRKVVDPKVEKTIEKMEAETGFWINNGCPSGKY